MNPLGASPASSLKEEYEVAAHLLQLLLQEQERLVEARIDGLPELTSEKSKTVTRLNELANSRHRALAAAGFKPKESGMQAWLDQSADDAAGQSWQDLLTLAKSARELNRTNGVLINKHMARNQNALNVLHGDQPGTGIYGPNGQAGTKTKTRGLVIG